MAETELMIAEPYIKSNLRHPPIYGHASAATLMATGASVVRGSGVLATNLYVIVLTRAERRPMKLLVLLTYGQLINTRASASYECLTKRSVQTANASAPFAHGRYHSRRPFLTKETVKFTRLNQHVHSYASVGAALVPLHSGGNRAREPAQSSKGGVPVTDFPKVVEDWNKQDRDPLNEFDGFPAWAVITADAILVVWCLAEVLMS